MDNSEYLLNVLHRVEAEGRRLGAAWVANARPGLTTEQMSQIMEPTGLRLPPSAQVLFGWHDGVEAKSYRSIVPSLEFMPLAEMVRYYFSWREGVETIWPEEPQAVWPAELFPILFGNAHDGVYAMMRCTPWSSPGIFRPENVVLSEYDSVYADAIRHYSLISLFELWLGWFNDGSVSCDPRGAWVTDKTARHRSTWLIGFL